MYQPERIDFACLRGDIRPDELATAVAAALAHRPRGICLNPAAGLDAHPALARSLREDLPGAGVLRQFVIDFPLGQGGARTKVAQAEALFAAGVADELDVVGNVGALLAGDAERFKAELRPVIDLGLPVKVIVETGYYPDDDQVLRRAVDWCASLGAFAIKTSTGFLVNVDNVVKQRHVRLWRAYSEARGYTLAIKDAGGKRSRVDIDAALEAGATIVGASAIIE